MASSALLIPPTATLEVPNCFTGVSLDLSSSPRRLFNGIKRCASALALRSPSTNIAAVTVPEVNVTPPPVTPTGATFEPFLPLAVRLERGTPYSIPSLTPPAVRIRTPSLPSRPHRISASTTATTSGTSTSSPSRRSPRSQSPESDNESISSSDPFSKAAVQVVPRARPRPPKPRHQRCPPPLPINTTADSSPSSGTPGALPSPPCSGCGCERHSWASAASCPALCSSPAGSLSSSGSSYSFSPTPPGSPDASSHSHAQTHSHTNSNSGSNSGMEAEGVDLEWTLRLGVPIPLPAPLRSTLRAKDREWALGAHGPADWTLGLGAGVGMPLALLDLTSSSESSSDTDVDVQLIRRGRSRRVAFVNSSSHSGVDGGGSPRRGLVGRDSEASLGSPPSILRKGGACTSPTPSSVLRMDLSPSPLIFAPARASFETMGNETDASDSFYSARSSFVVSQE